MPANREWTYMKSWMNGHCVSSRVQIFWMAKISVDKVTHTRDRAVNMEHLGQWIDIGYVRDGIHRMGGGAVTNNPQGVKRFFTTAVNVVEDAVCFFANVLADLFLFMCAWYVYDIMQIIILHTWLHAHFLPRIPFISVKWIMYNLI